MEINTNAGKTYTVVSEAGCTVSTADGKLIKEIAAGQDYFTAISGKTVISDDSAECVEVFKCAPIGGSGGGGGLNASGEPVQLLSGGTLALKHANWFDNSAQSAITVAPASWANEVVTSYLKTSVPVTLSGVQWLYGQPTMANGYTYVIALQQIDAVTVLANLAYTLPQ